MLVVGNWKSNGRRKENESLLSVLAQHAFAPADVAVCVPYPYLESTVRSLSGSGIAVGAQNVSAYGDGAYTGEVSAGMLSELGCRHVIVGHSERRALLLESDQSVAAKVDKALCAGLTPILCVGETLAERESGQVEAVISRQLAAVADAVDPARWNNLVVAYEPVWAIGTGKSATPEQVQAVLGFIRNWLVDAGVSASQVAILYGGSVKPATAEELFALPDCDGGLIGGASLQASDFIEICEAAVRASSRSTN